MPNNATGTINHYAASITVSRVAETRALPSFTRLTATYHPAGPRGHKIDQFSLPVRPD